MKNLLLAIPCLLLVSASVATAQPRTRRLDYRAPSECPDRSRFADEVAARVGFLPFEGAAEATTTVRILRDDSGPTIEFVGTLGLDVDGERAYRSGDCADLVATMAAAAAVAFAPPPAAPASPASVAPEPPAWAPGPEALAREYAGVRVSIDAPPDQQLTLELHQVADRNAAVMTEHFGRSHEFVCDAPCEIELDGGRYEFAVSNGGLYPVHTRPALMLDRDTHLFLGFDDRSGLRVAGGLTWLFGSLGGGALTAGVLESGAFALAGAGVILASTVVGIVLLFLEDTASVTPTF